MTESKMKDLVINKRDTVCLYGLDCIWLTTPNPKTGKVCLFSHSVQESNLLLHRRKLYKTKPCFKGMDCPYIEWCTFAHKPEELVIQYCRYMEKCVRHDCKFYHSNIDDKTKLFESLLEDEKEKNTVKKTDDTMDCDTAV